MAGVDEIGYVLAQEEAIARFESSRASSRLVSRCWRRAGPVLRIES